MAVWLSQGGFGQALDLFAGRDPGAEYFLVQPRDSRGNATSPQIHDGYRGSPPTHTGCEDFSEIGIPRLFGTLIHHELNTHRPGTNEEADRHKALGRGGREGMWILIGQKRCGHVLSGSGGWSRRSTFCINPFGN